MVSGLQILQTFRIGYAGQILICPLSGLFCCWVLELCSNARCALEVCICRADITSLVCRDSRLPGLLELLGAGSHVILCVHLRRPKADDQERGCERGGNVFSKMLH